VWSTRRALVSAAAVGSLLAGCSLLVHFDNQSLGRCADGGCADVTEEGPSGEGAPPMQDGAPSVDVGVDAPMEADPCRTLEAGAFCAYNGGCQCAYCDNAGACSQTHACPEGFNWEAGVDIARCCGGAAVLTDTNANCGVCGVQCMTAGVSSVQNCELVSGHYECANCAANTECWSGCCAIDTTPYHCSASDCATGACVAGLCPAPSQCVPGNGMPNYCSYD
jgi:hypothetical protein